MDKILIILIIILFECKLYGQTIVKIFDNSNPSNIDKIEWDLSNSQVINLIIEVNNVDFTNLKINVIDANTNLSLGFEVSPLIENSNLIKGRLLLDKDTRLGWKKIILSNDNDQYTKSFLLFSTKKPNLIAPSNITSITNNEAELILTLKNSLNFKSIYLADVNGNKENLFEINIIEIDTKNDKIKLKVFCPELRFINSNYYFWITDNNEPSAAYKSLRIDNVFNFTSTIRRFSQLLFFRGDKALLKIPNINSYTLNNSNIYKLEGLNQTSINLTYIGSELVSDYLIDFQSVMEDCKILENSSDASNYRIKIKIIDPPKIISNDLSWSEMDLSKITEGYVDYTKDKKFNISFEGLGLENIVSDLNSLTFSGSPNNMKILNVIIKSSNNYIATIEVPKNTLPGNYVLQYRYEGRTFDLKNIHIKEYNYPNKNLKFEIGFKKDKVYSINKNRILVESWDESNKYIWIKIVNNKDCGSQHLKLDINVKNDKNIIVATSSNIITIPEADSTNIQTSFGFFTPIDPVGYNISDWYTFDVQINHVKNNDSYYSIPVGSIITYFTEYVLKGSRAIISPQLSIPFSQTVFILSDSLIAAPYNVGLNINFRYRSLDDVTKVSLIYWGTGIYLSQSDLLKEQAIQLGLVGYFGFLYPNITNSNKFHISLGLGPNLNFKFKKDANTYDALSLALVLNIGYSFADF